MFSNSLDFLDISRTKSDLQHQWFLAYFCFLFFCRSLNERKSLELIVFQMLLEDKDSSWQYTMGKLLALDHLLSKATVSPEVKDSNGISEQSHPQTKSYSQKSLGRDPLFVALDLSFQNLSNRCGSSDNFTNLVLRIYEFF